MLSRRTLIAAACVALVAGPLLAGSVLAAEQDSKVTRFCRFQVGKTIAYGIVEGNRVRQLAGGLFGDIQKTNKTYALNEVKLLVPTRPTQVFAMAGNYKSHIGGNTSTTTNTITTVTRVTTNAKTAETTSNTDTTVETRRSGEIPKKFRIPQPFFKSPSCLLPQGEAIVLPLDAEVVHYEAEMVIVIGKKAKNVSRKDALEYVFGVTCGNDVSARVWQRGDVQWWRAKGADTFGPCGPFIAAGLDYDNLLMELRLNGEVRQHERTNQLLHDVSGTVSFISRHVTLHPGDLIYTGTPGSTAELKPGDVVEVEIEGVGVLRNPVVAGE